MNLMFSALLRSYSQTIQFYNYEMGADFGWSDGLYDTVKKAMGAE